MIFNFCVYFSYFIIYSFFGWILEIIVSLVYRRKLMNRGFLIGPYCPLYGCGILLLLFFLKDTENIYIAFFKICLICTVLEYMVSVLLEKCFNARWWDYSYKMLNIKGRVCFETTLGFGIVGCFVLYLLQPIISNFILSMDINVLIVFSGIMLVIFMLDLFLSVSVLNKLKTRVSYNKADNTQEVKNDVKNWIKNNNILYKNLNEKISRIFNL